MKEPRTKKRKAESSDQDKNVTEPDTSKPSAVFKPSGGRTYTLSLALPGSIIANALTHDQKTSLAGQIARACAVFCVDEIVVFDDHQSTIREPESGGYTAFADPNFFLYHLLTYLETPPHLRKALFPIHPDLRTAGTLPSLDMPHHLRSDEWCEYREGITLRSRNPRDRSAAETLVDCGLSQKVLVDDEIDADTRLTIDLSSNDHSARSHSADDLLHGVAVAPSTPREQAGYYWGYSTRQAESLGAIFTECPFDGGYDMSIGTSERGVPLSDLTDVSRAEQGYITPTWRHMLLVFGGVAGLESALKADPALQEAGVQRVQDIFDRWINLVPGQGSRTIRTEEAVWVGLSGIRQIVEARGRASEA